MPYPALPDRRIPYDNDGTVVGGWHVVNGIWWSGRNPAWLTPSEVLELQDYDYTGVGDGVETGAGDILFFPEQREVTAQFCRFGTGGANSPIGTLQGSNDTTNGFDGTWETASLGLQVPNGTAEYADQWRYGIGTVSFTGGKRTIKMVCTTSFTRNSTNIMHLYGEKVAGQTPNDIIYIDHDTTPGVEYTAPEDFGDRPLGTSVVRQFRIKNTSGSLTANAINIQCNDSDFAISTDSTTWVVTINIGSLGPGAQSATMYVRNTTPSIGAQLGPRYARIVTIVGSWT